MEFIYAKELKKEYVVYASFYQLEYDDGRKIACRNILEIFNRETYKDLSKRNKLDAIFIMMNSGRSKAKKKNYQAPSVKEADIIKHQQIAINLLETKPDNTQYQLMRIMKEKDWKHIKVLNLSDYRQAKSNEFYKDIEDLKQNDRYCIHSIFSKKRTKELSKYFNCREAKIIAAWGIDEALDELIIQAISCNKISKRIGVNINKDQLHYSHAGPQKLTYKVKWLESILKQV